MTEPGAAFAVVLAGGGGTRLWPSSRRARPKQLLRLGGPESLLAAAVRRAEAIFGRERTLVVTAADQLRPVLEAVPALPRDNVLAEPAARNTAAAVGLAAAHVLRVAGEAAVLAVLPADAWIGDEAGFALTLRAAVEHARQTIVTVGIRPDHPATGFGYVKLGAAVAGPGGARAVDRFVEKPDRATAESYLLSADHLWNSGMFFLGAGRMRDEARAHLPRLAAFIDAAAGTGDAGAFATTVRERYPDVESISIDYGIMEKATGLRVVPGDFGWNDVGSWSALAEIRTPDAAGNVAIGDVLLCDSSGTIVVSDPGAPFVGVVGAKDLVVVATADAVLVIPRDRAQDVRRIVDGLKAAGRTDLL